MQVANFTYVWLQIPPQRNSDNLYQKYQRTRYVWYEWHRHVYKHAAALAPHILPVVNRALLQCTIAPRTQIGTVRPCLHAMPGTFPGVQGHPVTVKHLQDACLLLWQS